MKKILSVLLITVVLMVCVSGCGQKKDTGSVSDTQEQDVKMKVVTTIFPEYDWVKEIAGYRADDIKLTMLLDNGVDLHSYQPTAEDIMEISDCDLFIYVGGESDAWVEDALDESVNKNMKVINLLDVLGESVKEEEIVEGMEGEEEEEEESGEEEPEYDEHVWLSLKNAKVICRAIADSMAEIDKEYANLYQENEADYEQKLDELDGEYQKAVDEASKKTILFGDRFPFRYLADDYGLNYYAAFVGCSAETEASFETVTFLAGKVDELGLKNIITIEKSDQKIAKTIIQNTKDKNQGILTMNSMQSITSEDIRNGASYLSIMEDNLSILQGALQ